jgi:LPXTG-motif cell wall-anchored protein
MPPEEAVVINPEGKEYDLGPLNPQERRQLEEAVDVAANEPAGAPPAGYGGASTSTGVNDGWLAAGGALLAASGLASFAYWRRRRSG